VVLNRTAERAAFLVEDLNEAFPNSHLSAQELTPQALVSLNSHIDMVVNTTSAGMHPDVDSCPWPADVPVSQKALFFDLVYNPLETKFLRLAGAAGAVTLDGVGMLVHQGAFPFEKWTGHQAPIEVMRAAAMARLKD